MLLLICRFWASFWFISITLKWDCVKFALFSCSLWTDAMLTRPLCSNSTSSLFELPISTFSNKFVWSTFWKLSVSSMLLLIGCFWTSFWFISIVLKCEWAKFTAFSCSFWTDTMLTRPLCSNSMSSLFELLISTFLGSCSNKRWLEYSLSCWMPFLFASFVSEGCSTSFDEKIETGKLSWNCLESLEKWNSFTFWSNFKETDFPSKSERSLWVEFISEISTILDISLSSKLARLTSIGSTSCNAWLFSNML